MFDTIIYYDNCILYVFDKQGIDGFAVGCGFNPFKRKENPNNQRIKLRKRAVHHIYAVYKKFEHEGKYAPIIVPIERTRRNNFLLPDSIQGKNVLLTASYKRGKNQYMFEGSHSKLQKGLFTHSVIFRRKYFNKATIKNDMIQYRGCKKF